MEITKYRKKIVEIEALQWLGLEHRQMFAFLGGNPQHPMGTDGENFYIDHSQVDGGLVIKTLGGEHIANVGDYIIKGLLGEYYPCNPEIFVMAYDPI